MYTWARLNEHQSKHYEDAHPNIQTEEILHVPLKYLKKKKYHKKYLYSHKKIDNHEIIDIWLRIISVYISMLYSH